MQTQMRSLLRSHSEHHPPLKMGALAIFLVGVALLVQCEINRLTDHELVFCLIPPVIALALLSGFRAALGTALLSVAAADYFLFKPYFAFDLDNKNDLLTLAAFACIVIPGAWIFSKMATRTRLLQLVQSELEMTLRSIGDAVLVVDAARKVAFMNPVAEKLTGWTLAEARGLTVDEVFRVVGEVSRSPIENPVQQVLSKGNAVSVSNHKILVSKQGVDFRIEESAAPIRLYEADIVVGAVLVFRNITDKYETEQRMNDALKTLEAVVAELSDGIIFADADGTSLRMNQAGLALHGFRDPSEVLDTLDQYAEIFSLRTLDDQILSPEQWPVPRVLRGEKFHDFEAIVTRKDNGHTFTGSYSGTPIFNENGTVKLAVITVRDITKRVETAAELRRAKEEAELASKLKTAFLANMSHEIRTPMTAVLGFAEVLKSSDLSPAERDDAVERIGSSGKALLHLIDDILDVSKIEAGKLEIHTALFHPVETAAEIVNLLQGQAQKKGIELRLRVKGSFPETAHSDAARVRQILINLVGNAVKFTTSGHVDVSLAAEGPDLLFEVSDTGIGIAPDHQEKLFKPFSQADDSITRKFGGTGLGLTLSRQIAALLGGTVTLEDSKQGEGSRFVARIPAAPFGKTQGLSESRPNPRRNETDSPSSGILHGIAVLAAEDVQDNQVLLRIYLRSAGVGKIDFVGNGEEAVAKALAGQYDVVLMDIQMPGMDGITATKILRERGYRGPILALTAHAMPDEVRNILQAGCNGHIPKPIEKNDLLLAIADSAQARSKMIVPAPSPCHI